MNQSVQVDNHLTFNIVATVFATLFSMLSCCCLPLGLATGIPAIVFSNKVNSLLAMGDDAGARIASEKAKLWGRITAGLAVLFLVLLVFSVLANIFGWVDNPGFTQMMEELEKAQRNQ